jgi:hypothetical protein
MLPDFVGIGKYIHAEKAGLKSPASTALSFKSYRNFQPSTQNYVTSFSFPFGLSARNYRGYRKLQQNIIWIHIDVGLIS